MKLALLRRADYPEPVGLELDQLVSTITTSYAVEHDADGRQRLTCAKWSLGADQSLTHNVPARIAVSLPDARNAGDIAIELGGIVRIRVPGVYTLVGQIRYASNVTGVRAVQLRRNAIEVAFTAAGSVANAWVQATETVPCQRDETIELWGYQTSGGALAAESASGQTFLRVVRVG